MPTSRKKPAAKPPAAAKTKKAAAPAKGKKAAAVVVEDQAPAPGKGFDLVVVESPAKAKTINKYLGSAYKVLASYGHVRDLAERKLKGEEVAGIRIADGWKLRYTVDEAEEEAGRKRRSPKNILAEIGKEAKRATRVLLASDPDREGESIAWHIADELQLDPKRVYRIRFNEITKTAIQNALAQPEAVDMDRVKAQEARRAMDRVVGFPLSNLLAKKVTRGLSAGRVQSVAVKLIVDREREIEAFVTEEYWKLTALLSPHGSGVSWTADPKKEKIYAKKKGDPEKPVDDATAAASEAAEVDKPEDGAEAPEEKAGIPTPPPGSFLAELAKWNGATADVKTEADADTILDAIRDVPYVVSKIEQKDRQERAQPPFITSTLQQQASIRLRFPTSRTMQTAQKLYEGIELGKEGQVALITYMRTDSTRVSNDALTMVREHIQRSYGEKYLPEKPNAYASGKAAQEAHEAIRPTDLTQTPQKVQQYLSNDQYRLYKLIYERFVASQMVPAVFAVTAVEVEAGKALFKATGKIEKFDGYRRVLPPVGKQEDVTLPALAEKQPLDKLDLYAGQHFTQPPSRFNEASLVKALEKEGIGRPSTYSSIIGTIQRRGYVEQKDRRFFATEIGKVVTDLLVQHFPKIMDLQFTSHFEEELDEIETGKYRYEDVLDEFWGPFSQALDAAKDGMQPLKTETGEMCPECGKPLVARYSAKTKKKFVGCSGWRDDPPCKYFKPGEGDDARPKAEPTEFTCPKCGKMMLKRAGKSGPFLGCSGYPECKTTMNIGADGQPVLSAVETEFKCEKCGSPMVKREGRRGPFLGCSAYPKCRNVVDLGADGKPAKPIETGVVCDKCGKPMTVKRGPRGPFLACTGYPGCRNAKPVPADLKEKIKDLLPPPPPKQAMPEVEIPDPCPECGGPMRLQKSRFGGRFFLGCKNYPKCKGTAKVSPELEAKIAEATTAAAPVPS
ncbi:MAG TPA: type I DNA topoisomerase [Fimbriiglobus sp.]